MIDLLVSLFQTPESERDPADWATRFMAHLGLGVMLTVLLIAVLPLKFALGASIIGYTIFEALQYRQATSVARTAALQWDGVLDLVAWTSGAGIVAWLSVGAIGNAALLVVAALVVISAGVWQRQRRK